MNRDEASLLVDFVAACCPRQRITAATPAAYAHMLRDVPLREAQAVVETMLARGCEVIEMGPLLAEIRGRRTAVVEHDIGLAITAPTPGGDIADDANHFIAQLRAHLGRAAIGQQIPRPPALAAGSERGFVAKPGQDGHEPGTRRQAFDPLRRRLHVVTQQRAAQRDDDEDRPYVLAHALLATLDDPADIDAYLKRASMVLGEGATARDLEIKAADLVREAGRQAAG